MAQPQGTLTELQLEILEVVWDAPRRGSSVAEIWRALSGRREIARTTVLTMVQRLANRGWLRRTGEARSYRYKAALGRARAARRLAVEFVDGFFGGSTSELVMSLLGSKRVSRDELQKLRALIDAVEGEEER